MILITLLILAGIGAIIGWVTNLLAVKLLFRPFEPVILPVINLKIQGLIPKRRNEIAVSIGEAVEKDLLSIEDVIHRFMDNHDKEKVLKVLKKKINTVISERLPGIIPSPFKNMIQNYMDDIIKEEGEKIIDEMMEDIIQKGASSIQISEIIEEKINEFPMEKLEEVVLSIANKELKHIEILGAVLGFIIGLLQGVIIISLY